MEWGMGNGKLYEGEVVSNGVRICGMTGCLIDATITIE